MGALRLTIREGTEPERVVSVDGFPAEIGRDARANVRIEAPAISGVHCALYRAGGLFFVLDRRSRNGTVINGKRIAPGRLKELSEGDEIAIGHVTITVRTVEAGASGGTRTRFKDLLGSADLAEAHAGAFIVVTNGPDAGRSLPLDVKGATVLGRAPACDLRLGDRGASAKHCRIALTGGMWEIADLGSKNGTRVDGRRVAGRRGLKNGNEIYIGGTVVRFIASAQAADAGTAAPGTHGRLRPALLYALATVAGAGSIGLAAALMYCVFS